MNQHNTQAILFIAAEDSGCKSDSAHNILTNPVIAVGCIQMKQASTESSFLSLLNQYPNLHMVVIVVPENGVLLEDALLLSRLAKKHGYLSVVTAQRCGKTPNEFLSAAKLSMDQLMYYTDCVLLLPIYRSSPAAIVYTTEHFYRDVQIFCQFLTTVITGNGFIYLELEDISSIFKDGKFAYLGVGHVKGSDTSVRLSRMESTEFLPKDILEKASCTIVYVTGSEDIGLSDIEATVNLIQTNTSSNTPLLFGAEFDSNLHNELHVDVLVTGIEA